MNNLLRKTLACLVFLLLCGTFLLKTKPIEVLAEESNMSNYFDEDDIRRWEQEMEEKFSAEPVRPDPKNTARSPVGEWSWRDGVICISSSSTFLDLITVMLL